MRTPMRPPLKAGRPHALLNHASRRRFRPPAPGVLAPAFHGIILPLLPLRGCLADCAWGCSSHLVEPEAFTRPIAAANPLSRLLPRGHEHAGEHQPEADEMEGLW